MPVAAAMIGAQHLYPIALDTIDDDERESRDHELARTSELSPAPHPRMGIEVRGRIVQSGRHPCRGGWVPGSDVVDDLLEVVAAPSSQTTAIGSGGGGGPRRRDLPAVGESFQPGEHMVVATNGPPASA